MTRDTPDQLLQQLCGELRLLRRQAGGPSLRELSKQVGLGKTQVGAILNGDIRTLPDWAVVKGLVESCHRYARDHGRMAAALSQSSLDGFWRPRYAVLEHAATHVRGRPAGLAATAEPAPGAPRVVPRQLPPGVQHFAGRTAELATLTSWADRVETDGGATVITALDGMAGIGKTALAVHWAYQVADRFPDGQLYVNLRGYDPDLPQPATDALAGFLTALGVAGSEIPLEVNERAARYRTELARRRMLIVLDNAATAEQVRPLLPGTGTNAVLVTSRDSLAGLIALDGARRLDLGLLAPTDARTLLHRLIGPRADADPDAIATLAELCGRLPLALRVGAELAVSRPTTTLAALAEELADQQERLDLLDAGGDPRAAVAAVFSWSIQHLPPDAARTFRLLGLYPGADLEAHAVAALAGATVATARRTLDTLTRAHLTHITTTGRYGMHDLLRAYAIRLATAEDSEDERRTALLRLFDYYLATSAAAMDSLYPAEAHRRPTVPPVATPVPDLTDPDIARSWLDAERATLVAVAAHSATHAVHLSATLWRYLDGGHHVDAVNLHTHAHRFAQRAGELAGQATALHGLGTAHTWLSQYPAADDYLRQALTLFRQAGDQSGELRAHASLGIIAGLTGSHESAAVHFAQALTLSQQIDDPAGVANALLNLGVIDTKTARYEAAFDHLEQALALFRRDGNRVGVANALDSLGLVEQRLGRYGPAAHHLEEALALFRRLGVRQGEARTLDTLGIVYLRLGRPEQAATHFQQALNLFREVGDQEGQSWALNGLGETADAAGRPADALTHHTAAFAIAAEIAVLDQQARAHTGLGHAHLALGSPADAHRHYESALTLYTDLDSPQANDIRAHIAAISGPGPSAPWPNPEAATGSPTR